MRSKKVTIVTVTYNCVDLLEGTIKSILSQTFNDYEYIIIDGGSTDGTIDVINKYKTKLSFWCSEKDNGIFDAMNKGINHANGEWINFMNAGDFFYDENVLDLVFSDNNTESFSFIYGDNVVINGEQTIYKKANPFYKSKKIHRRMGFNHQSVFVKTNLAKKNQFDLNFKIAADYNMINKIYKSGGRPLYISSPLSITNLNGISAKNRNRQLYEEEIISNANKNIRYRFYKFLKAFKDKIW